ncbi:NB-ARC domain-containing protein [Allokutzneria sp. A3M-2-11 16]|uniref:AfsR/SARP family transcriptional regulator n=1 Tax=Allokutzneria sp. A3M-2-11 16 TaxID=2962043 RepID=UPI0020B8288C|nr:BTAD domain-containing putative transcriptional regulator [Allokutzneria sp. A3M-2-11 16]MCP3805262.1 NB-ARC domain-containing protein [Allokutzneria sp. A3M-2-11 16]
MRFRVLGALDVRDAGGAPVVLNRRKQRVALAILLSRANRPVRTAELVGQLWGDEPPPSAAANLQSYLAGLRKVLEDGGAPRLPASRGGYLLRVEPGELDAERFERLAAEGGAALAAGEAGLALDRLTRALELWRGAVLEDLPLPPALEAEAARLTQLRLDATEDRFSALLALGRHDVAAAELPPVTSAHPLRERLWELEMRALHRCGRQGDALATYRRAEVLLREELGVEPGAALRELRRRILDGDLSLNPARASAVLPRQLPLAVPDFLGREEELARLDAEPGPIVVITGAAGIGKTALALHWAHRAAERFPDGQLHVDLRGGAAPLDVLTAFLVSLGVPVTEVPASVDAAAALFRSALADRRMLIMVDDADSADQIRPLLPGTAPCTVVVTSRNRLSGLVAVQGASRVELGPLPSADSIALLGRVTGEALVMTEYGAAEEIVRLCGGNPLAVRIAGANRCGQSLREHARDLSTEDFFAALVVPGDEAASLPAAFARTQERLSFPAQRLLALLGLLPHSSFTLGDAAGLLRTSTTSVRRPLGELVAWHLVRSTMDGFTIDPLTRRLAAVLGAGTPAPAPAPTLSPGRP